MNALILASASTVRARLLKAAGVRFDVHPAGVDEDAVKASLLAEKVPPRGIADALAELKAVRVSLSHPDRLVLGADQVLVLDDELISKSETMAAARALLARLRGTTHSLISAMVLARNGAPVWRFIGTARLTMRDFSDAFLEEYLAQEGEALLSGVGCYKLERLGIGLFSQITGDYFSILGLPMLPLMAALREQGVVRT